MESECDRELLETIKLLVATAQEMGARADKLHASIFILHAFLEDLPPKDKQKLLSKLQASSQAAESVGQPEDYLSAEDYQDQLCRARLHLHAFEIASQILKVGEPTSPIGGFRIIPGGKSDS